VDIVTAERAHAQARVVLSRVTDVLIFLSCLALWLGATGVACAVRAFVMDRVDAIAVLRCLGASGREIVGVFLIQALMMGAVGSVAGALGGLLGQGFLVQVMGGETLDALMAWGRGGQSLEMGGWDGGVVAGGVAMGLVMTTAAAWLPLLGIRRVQPIRLMRREVTPGDRPTWDGRRVGAFGVVGLLMWGAATWETSSWLLAGWLTVGSAAAAGLLWGGGLFLQRAARRWPLVPKGMGWVIRHGWMNALRGSAGMTVGLAALGLGVACLGTLTMVQSSLMAELRAMGGRRLTGLFLIDIQPDQKSEVEAWLSREGVSDVSWAPLVRARLTAINGVPNPPGRLEDSGESWARHREWNLSWRDELGEDERLVAGRYMRSSSPALPPRGGAEASLEQTFAKRLGVGLGDRLEVDIQGRKIEATITSLRVVKWTSFRPNFFVLWSRADLEGAPHTWVASLPRLAPDSQSELQNRLIERFPNLTAIDVTEAMNRLAELVNGVLSALRGVSLLVVAAGLAVIVAMVVSSVRERLREVVLWRLLGASGAEVLGMLCTEFAVWGILACGLGLTLAAGASSYLFTTWFELSWQVEWQAVGIIVVGVIGLTVTVGWLMASELLIHPPLEVLRQE